MSDSTTVTAPPPDTKLTTSKRSADSVDRDAEGEDPELEAMKRRVKEMEEEAAKLREMQAQVEKEMSMAGLEFGNTAEADSRSVYVGNVDYSATPEELQAHFQACGTINRITILCDRWTGQPKGYAYIEFAEPAHVANAMALNESLFRNRLIKVMSKRTNVPGFNARGRGRGRPFSRGSGGGGSRGGFRGSRGSRRAQYTPY